MESSSSSEEEEEGGTGGKNEEDEFIHHPFKVKDTSSIVLNIRVGGQIIFFLSVSVYFLFIALSLITLMHHTERIWKLNILRGYVK